jgi:hypothetical protein
MWHAARQTCDAEKNCTAACETKLVAFSDSCNDNHTFDASCQKGTNRCENGLVPMTATGAYEALIRWDVTRGCKLFQNNSRYTWQVCHADPELCGCRDGAAVTHKETVVIHVPQDCVYGVDACVGARRPSPRPPTAG